MKKEVIKPALFLFSLTLKILKISVAVANEINVGITMSNNFTWAKL